jgi:hypothetical protein
LYLDLTAGTVITGATMAKMEKDKDEIWLLRKLFSKPNYAVLKLLMVKAPRTTRELYTILGKSFTRKTLIITLRNLSMNLNILQPTHIRTERGYDLGYNINPNLKEIVKSMEKFEKTIEKITNIKE